MFILQLKRFCFFTNDKISDPVKLQRDIVVRSAEVKRTKQQKPSLANHILYERQRQLLFLTSLKSAACYSLVSVINHLGTLHGGDSYNRLTFKRAKVLTAAISLLPGHYVSDCIYPDRSPDDLSDPWMILNDAVVIPATGADVCEQRSRLGYILFYKRNVSTTLPRRHCY